MIKAFAKKLNSKKGETLVESLAGLIVIVLAVMILAGAIASSVKINTKIKNADTNFNGGGTEVIAGNIKNGDQLVLKHNTTTKEDTILYDENVSLVTEYKTNNDYYYYKVKK